MRGMARPGKPQCRTVSDERVALLTGRLRLVSGLVVAFAARIKHQAHEADADDQRKEDAERHGCPAVTGHLHVAEFTPGVTSPRTSDAKEKQQNQYCNPASESHS
jgi:hypothetical protein